MLDTARGLVCVCELAWVASVDFGVRHCVRVCSGDQQCKLPSNSAALLKVVFINVLHFKGSLKS
jgi:hypothetical protein